MPVYEGGAGVPTPGGVDMVSAWVAPPEDEDGAAEAEPDAAPVKSRAKKAAAGA
jgi:hypothetical protein